MMIKKEILKGKTLEELRQWAEASGEKKFRGDQLFNWIYNKMAVSFDEMMNIPKELRSKLNDTAEINVLNWVGTQESKTEGTVKLLLQTALGHNIECVIIPEEERVTLCVSTQVGCPLDCKFCATGLMGYKRNLTAGEIFEQYAIAQRYYDRRITNIVYMGMGEPLLNFDNTVKSLDIFSEELSTGISQKKITVSTAGIAPRIYDFADTGIKSKLALSLHSCFEDIRTLIMPINKKYPLKDVLDACKYYGNKTKSRITFEYVMLKGLNDRDEDLKALIKLTRRIQSKINIIPFNSLKHMNPDGFSAELVPTPQKRIDEFAQILRDNDITVIVRDTQGSDIAAACGQLAAVTT